MQQQSASNLQQKQGYLRDNIQADKHQDFCEYCEKVVGSVDINSWTLSQVKDIVNKFNVYMKQQANKNNQEHGRYTYNQYQSRSNFQPGHVALDTNTQKDQPSEISQCKSSRIVKTSAVDLLDQVLGEQNYSSVKTQQKKNIPPPSSPKVQISNQNQRNSSTFNQTFNTTQNLSSNNKHRTSGADFNQFQFWTSTIGSKNQGEQRHKSSNQSVKPNPNILSPPPTTKNANANTNVNTNNANQNINIDYYYKIQYGGIQTHNQAFVNAISPTAEDPNKAILSTQQLQPNSGNLKTQDFDIFATGITPDNSKKSSPYLKKQVTQPYQGQKSSIKLKQVKQFHQSSKSEMKQKQRERGQSVFTKGTNTSHLQQQFQSQITCYKSAIRNQLADRSLNIYIDKHQIIQRKFLASDYAMYNVKIAPLGIQCKRNYQDFSKLKANLAKFFPGICLPYLEETSWLSGTNAEFIANQKKMLELFSRDLIRNKEIRNSRLMQDFLTLKQHKAIKRKFENYQKMEPLKGLQQLCLLQGKVNATLNPQQKNYIENLQKFIYKMGQLYTRQQKLTQTLISQYTQIMQTFKSQITLMQEMQKQIKQFNTKVTTNTIKYLGKAVQIMKQTYKQQYSNMKFDHQVNSKKILPFLKYQKRNFYQLTSLIDIEKKMKKVYDKRSLSQKINPNQHYMSQRAKQSKTSILQQSSNLVVLKHQAGYLGYQARNEGQRIFDELAVKTVIRWQTLGQSYLNKLTNSIDYWQNLLKIDREKFNTQLTY